jgi:hypothetical protein
MLWQHCCSQPPATTLLTTYRSSGFESQSLFSQQAATKQQFACHCCVQVAVKVVDLSEAPAAIRQALRREAEVVLRVSGECRHACQYKGATIKANKFCLVMKRQVLLILAADTH